ncbi:hypothetical protein D9758_016459 [Tetrapyrgos nigripes]|uniref:Uncharacterized protein n=1 Tax=Tetrapyrgos nigripes TaxID=182062 RepID=A0A8H5CDG5_9AGAR|nr:hypothetical protein D9758_016459 [Tetrapyrgos nigripes]
MHIPSIAEIVKKIAKRIENSGHAVKELKTFSEQGIHDLEPPSGYLQEWILQARWEPDQKWSLDGQIKYESELDSIINGYLSSYCLTYRGFRVCPQWSYQPPTKDLKSLKEMYDWSMYAVDPESDSSESEGLLGDFEQEFALRPVTSTPPRPCSSSSSVLTSPSRTRALPPFGLDPLPLSQPVVWPRLSQLSDTPQSKKQIVDDLPLGDQSTFVQFVFDSLGRAVDPKSRIVGRPDFVVTLQMWDGTKKAIIVVEDKIRNKGKAKRQLQQYMKDLYTGDSQPILGMAFVLDRKGLRVALLRRSENEQVEQLEERSGAKREIWFSPLDEFVHRQVVEVVEQALRDRGDN